MEEVCFFSAAKNHRLRRASNTKPEGSVCHYSKDQLGTLEGLKFYICSHLPTITYSAHPGSLCPQSLCILFALDNLPSEYHEACFLYPDRSSGLSLHITFSVNPPYKPDPQFTDHSACTEQTYIHTQTHAPLPITLLYVSFPCH